jgi:hypothetical protein
MGSVVAFLLFSCEVRESKGRSKRKRSRELWGDACMDWTETGGGLSTHKWCVPESLSPKINEECARMNK